jgi:hypothetical protein
VCPRSSVVVGDVLTQKDVNRPSNRCAGLSSEEAQHRRRSLNIVLAARRALADDLHPRENLRASVDYHGIEAVSELESGCI